LLTPSLLTTHDLLDHPSALSITFGGILTILDFGLPILDCSIIGSLDRLWLRRSVES
jgi:hypothetical protein